MQIYLFRVRTVDESYRFLRVTAKTVEDAENFAMRHMQEWNDRIMDTGYTGSLWDVDFIELMSEDAGDKEGRVTIE